MAHGNPKPQHEPQLPLPEHVLRREWYGEQDENGVDISLLRANLRLTPTERLRQGDQATTDALRLRAHARRVS
jgi:hypothetical protein